MRSVVGRYAHRALDVLVLLFAALGFVYVPLGKHTGYEHAKAILATGAASRAGRELSEAVDRLRGRVVHDATSDPDRGPSPKPPRFGSRSGDDVDNAHIAPIARAAAELPDASAPWSPRR
jgi:hypothetical protein